MKGGAGFLGLCILLADKSYSMEFRGQGGASKANKSIPFSLFSINHATGSLKIN